MRISFWSTRMQTHEHTTKLKTKLGKEREIVFEKWLKKIIRTYTLSDMPLPHELYVRYWRWFWSHWRSHSISFNFDKKKNIEIVCEMILCWCAHSYSSIFWRQFNRAEIQLLRRLRDAIKSLCCAFSFFYFYLFIYFIVPFVFYYSVFNLFTTYFSHLTHSLPISISFLLFLLFFFYFDFVVDDKQFLIIFIYHQFQFPAITIHY